MITIIKISPERTTTLDGMMTFGTTDDGQYVLNFAATEEDVELPTFKATCRVQGMRNGDVYITQLPSAATRRNPQVYVGRRITVTRRSDGSLRPNFRPVAMGNDFDSAAYATEVANELLWALTSLVGKKAAR